MMYGYGLEHGFGFFGGIFMLVFWVLVIWLIVAFVRGASGYDGKSCFGKLDHDDRESTDKALDILRERFAKGDITKEEFEEKSQILKKLN